MARHLTSSPRLMIHRTVRRGQRGFSLIEALIGFLVLSLGVLGMQRLQSSLRYSADAAHQRSEAVRLAQQAMEQLRATAAEPAGAAPPTDLQTDGSSARYTVQPALTPEGLGPLNRASVRVQWQDRSGSAQSIVLETGLDNTPARHSALLSLPSQDLSVAPVRQLPWGATQLNDGSGLLPRAGRPGEAWRFRPLTGQVSFACSGVTLPGDRLPKASDLGRCEALQGTLLSGFIRFSLGASPDASNANDEPLPLQVALQLDNPSIQPECDIRRVNPAQGDRFIAYVCRVPLSAEQTGWSGRLTLQPEGWAVGHDAGARKVCRYSQDLDGSGRIDRNVEHPDRYRDVNGPLVLQNYLVIRGDLACPQAVPPHNEASAATVQHQP